MNGFQITKVALGITLLVVVPGFALTLALFPKKEDIAFVERLGFSFLLGFLPQLILYLGDKNFGIPINSSTTLLWVLGITIVSLGVWQFRLRNLR